MNTHVQKVKEELRRAAVDQEGAFVQLFDRALHVIESLEEAIEELERDLSDLSREFDALNKEFDDYVDANED